MITVETEPIHARWIEVQPDSVKERTASIAKVTGRLAMLDIDDIDTALTPLLAAAAAEVALETGIPWRYRSDDPPVALVRLIAKVAERNPTAGGPHTARLLEQLP